MLGLLRRIAIDVSPLRESREFRLLVLGQIVSNLGTQAALVALPYQIFVISHSAALVGLLGAFELGPMVIVSLLGGALNDRMDRRRLLALAQAGVIIAASSVGVAYVIDAASCLAMLAAALAVGPHRPERADAAAPITRSIADGLRFVRSSNALAGSFAIDLVAMTFGWPRALFAVLSLTVYHAGAGGTGLLYAALAAGGTLAILTSGWIGATRRLGRIVIVAVLAWASAVAGMGLVRSIGPALAMLTVVGYADGVSAFCRSAINQTITPDQLRGRMSAVHSLVVTSGPRLGDIESGLVAGLTSAATSVATGGLARVLGRSCG